MHYGSLTISLDFELYWGVKDHRSLRDYGDHIRGARVAIPKLLKLFEEYEVHATWATVGYLFHDGRNDLLEHQPAVLPTYTQSALSNAATIAETGDSESADPLHFAPSLIPLIAQTPGQEIATHTYSHYYCLEPGQTPEQFRADLHMALSVAAEKGYGLTSIVFPRNQYARDYLRICKEEGITAYRGNAENWIYDSSARAEESTYRRALRLLDSYVSWSPSQIHEIKKAELDLPINVPASRFFRPYNPSLSFIEGLKIARIKREMFEAARKRKVYHLWWHPHNFGMNTVENIAQLRLILDYYLVLQKQYGMKSLNMSELAALV